MSVHTRLYSWSIHGNRITIEYEAWSEFLGMCTGTASMYFTGTVQQDGSVFWLRDDGAVIGPKMEKELNHAHRQYCLKHGIKPPVAGQAT